MRIHELFRRVGLAVILLLVLFGGGTSAFAGVSSDGSVFRDEMSDLTNWSTHYVGGPTGGTITPSGNYYTVGGPRWDSYTNAEIYTTDAINYGGRTQWAVEIRFRVNSSPPLSDSTANRQVGLLIGASGSSTGITGIRDYCVTLLEHPTNGNQFNIGWGDINGMQGMSPETMIADISRFEYHTLVLHHTVDNTIDVYLDGVYKTRKAAIGYGGSLQAQRVFISDGAQAVGANLDIDYVKIGDPAIGSGITSTGSILNSEFKDLTGWGVHYVGGANGGIIAPLPDSTNINSKWQGGDSGSYTEMYTTVPLSYGSLNEGATEMRFRVNSFSTGEPLSTDSPRRQVGLLIGAKADSPGDSWDPTVEYSVLLLQGTSQSKFSLAWGKLNDDTLPPSILMADLNRGNYYTLVLHHKSNNEIDIYIDGVYIGTKPAICDGGACRASRIFVTDSAQAPSVSLDIDYLRVGAAISETPSSPSWTLKTSAAQTIYQNGVPHTDRRGNPRTTYSPTSSFFPLAPYNAYEGSTGGAVWSFSQFAAAGFNTVHLGPGYPASTVVADSAANAGLQVIGYVPTDQQILDLRNHPATLAWLPLEEPGNTGWTYDQYVARIAEIKALDPSHPVFMLDTPGIYEDAWITWNTTGDITSHDNYPVNLMSDGTDRSSLSYYMGIPETVSLAVSANNESKPMWFCVQAFGYIIKNALFQIPSTQQLRCMVYTAIVHGATGIIYFVPDSPGARASYLLGISPEPLADYNSGIPNRGIASADQINQSRNLWMETASLNSEITNIKASLLSPTANVTYEVYVDSSMPSVTPTPVRTMLKRDPAGGYTLLVVNVDSLPQRVRVRFQGSLSLTATEQFKSGSQFTLSGDCLEFTCLAYDVRVFHIVGDSAEIPASSQLRVDSAGVMSTSKIVGWTSGKEYRQLAEFDISSYKDRPLSNASLKFDAAAIWSQGSVLDIDLVPSDLHIDSADFGSASLAKLTHAGANNGVYAVDVTDYSAAAMAHAVPSPGSYPWGRGVQFRWSDSAAVWNSYGYTVSNPILELQFGIPEADEITIAQSKLKPEGSAVSCTGVVTARFGDHFYIEATDRSSGIRVNAPDTGRADGEWVSVIGRVITLDSGERCIDVNPYVTPASGTGTVSPVGMTGISLGGGDFGIPPLGQAGITGGNGLNSIGLLVRTWGKVMEVDSGATPAWFTLSDGSGSGVKVVIPTGVPAPEQGYYVVTGVCSCYRDQSSLKPMVKPRAASDIERLM